MNTISDLSNIKYTPEYPYFLLNWNSFHPIFNKLILEIKPSIIFEVGTWIGSSAINMCDILKENNLNSKVYCIDTWLGAEEFLTWAADTHSRDLKCKYGYPQVYYQFLSNVFIKKHQDIIVPIPNTSHIASVILKYHKIKPNLIYIDGSHDYKDVLSDLQDYFPFLDKGEIIFGDDISWEGVRKAVEEFCINNKISYSIEDNNFWVIRK